MNGEISQLVVCDMSLFLTSKEWDIALVVATLLLPVRVKALKLFRIVFVSVIVNELVLNMMTITILKILFMTFHFVSDLLCEFCCSSARVRLETKYRREENAEIWG